MQSKTLTSTEQRDNNLVATATPQERPTIARPIFCCQALLMTVSVAHDMSVEMASDMSATQAAKVRDDAEHVFLHKDRDGAGD